MAAMNQTMMRLGSRLHAFLYGMTGGRIGTKFRGMPVLLLTTTGRKTGKSYTTPLMYIQDGDDYIIAASNGGAPRDPGWWPNLRANPRTSIEVGAKKLAVTAERLDGPERDRVWWQLTKGFAGYAEYERVTSRPIP